MTSQICPVNNDYIYFCILPQFFIVLFIIYKVLFVLVKFTELFNQLKKRKIQTNFRLSDLFLHLSTYVVRT